MWVPFLAGSLVVMDGIVGVVGGGGVRGVWMLKDVCGCEVVVVRLVVWER